MKSCEMSTKTVIGWLPLETEVSRLFWLPNVQTFLRAVFIMLKHFHQPWYWLSKSTPPPALFISQFCQQIQFSEFSAFQPPGEGQLPTLVVNINGIVQGTEGYKDLKWGWFLPSMWQTKNGETFIFTFIF